MSNLQISLAVIGAVLLALIVAYNAWTTHRNAPRKAQPPERDASAEPAQRLEPALDESEASVPTVSPVHGLDHGPEPSIHGVDVDDALHLPVPPAHASPERWFQLDPLIDAIAPIVPEQPVSGEAALAALPPTRRAGSKPFAIEAFNDASGQWETPVPGQRYRAFQAGVQLANRMGALNEIEFSEFVMKAQAFADAINAAPEFPDMLQEVARARELDQFASAHDAQMVFRMRSIRAAWSPGYIMQQAESAGFVPGAIPGRMVLPASDPVSGPLVVLQFETSAALDEDPDQSALFEFELLFDVPQAARSEQPYARLREAARALAASMEGRLTDERGVALSDSTLDQVGEQLERLYGMLESRDFAAGSPLARRLFS